MKDSKNEMRKRKMRDTNVTRVAILLIQDMRFVTMPYPSHS